MIDIEEIRREVEARKKDAMTNLPFLCRNCTNSNCLIWRIYAETSTDDGILYPAIKNCLDFRDELEGEEGVLKWRSTGELE
jgi:hypothetical protein